MRQQHTPDDERADGTLAAAALTQFRNGADVVAVVRELREAPAFRLRGEHPGARVPGWQWSLVGRARQALGGRRSNFIRPVQVRKLYEEWCLSLEDGRQLDGRTITLPKRHVQPATHVAVPVAVAAATDEPAAAPAAIALVDETLATDTTRDTIDPIEHRLAAAGRLLGQQIES